MTKQEFARRAMEIVEVCIEKDINFEFCIDTTRGQHDRLEIFSSINCDDSRSKIVYLDWDIVETRLPLMKKLVEEYEG